MTSDQDKQLREQLVHVLRGDQSHIDFDAALDDFPIELAGKKLEGAPHTAWQLLEHMRIALHDILEFSRDPKHQPPKWPEGYWPDTEEPSSHDAWQESIAAFRQCTHEIEALITDPTQDLFQPIAGGTGQTLLREAIVAGNHNSYHLGQLLFLKRALQSDK
jgi:hypothetical protein